MLVRPDQAVIARLNAAMYGNGNAYGVGMAEDRKRPAKSESLTIRLNPRTRFVLEFVARLRGQTITTVVERALEAAGDQAKISKDHGEDVTWKDFWNVSEGARSLKIAEEPELFPAYEEEKRLHLAKRFWPYFYNNSTCDTFHRTYLDIVWPEIDSLVELHDKTKATDFYAVEIKLRQLIENARVTLPKSVSGVKTPKEKGAKPNYDLDDDIPF